VITTASARNFDFLSQLGANEVIDYRMDRFEDSQRDFSTSPTKTDMKTLTFHLLGCMRCPHNTCASIMALPGPLS
jgi:hypothetical protein